MFWWKSSLIHTCPLENEQRTVGDESSVRWKNANIRPRSIRRMHDSIVRLSQKIVLFTLHYITLHEYFSALCTAGWCRGFSKHVRNNQNYLYAHAMMLDQPRRDPSKYERYARSTTMMGSIAAINNHRIRKIIVGSNNSMHSVSW